MATLAAVGERQDGCVNQTGQALVAPVIKRRRSALAA
jgi:hypothetical protein